MYYSMTAGFPFNWDPQRVGTCDRKSQTRQGLLFPFNWDPQRVGTFMQFVQWDEIGGFHSIGIPSEWGHIKGLPQNLTNRVSIQLGSPASGDTMDAQTGSSFATGCFHSIGIPSEWGPLDYKSRQQTSSWTFPFNWDPQRVGTQITETTD